MGKSPHHMQWGKPLPPPGGESTLSWESGGTMVTNAGVTCCNMKKKLAGLEAF